jgi:hypothetical protein
MYEELFIDKFYCYSINRKVLSSVLALPQRWKEWLVSQVFALSSEIITQLSHTNCFDLFCISVCLVILVSMWFTDC